MAAHSDENESEDREYSENKEISPEDIQTYFKVDLMYIRDPGFPKRTYLHYTLDLIPPTEHSVDSMSTDYPWSNTLLNDPMEKHAETKFSEALEQLTFKQDTKERSRKKTSISGHMLNDIGKNHAETKLLKKLESKIKDFEEKTQAKSTNDQKSKMILNIVINYSPCADCADDIVKFCRKQKDWESKISITFGSFYLFYKDDKNKYIEGLAKLLNAGIQLKLLWDDPKLKKYIEKIGPKDSRKAREKKDRKYLLAVEEKARQIAASMK